jgi:nucleoside-diphosphate-sugar epimerase
MIGLSRNKRKHKGPTRVAVVGYGDIAARLMQQAPMQRCQVIGLVRDAMRSPALRAYDVMPIVGDLDVAGSFDRICRGVDVLIHLAPPAQDAAVDTRTRRLLASLAKGSILPKRLIYISTTGVYGNGHGRWLTECTPCQPNSARAIRRVHAEQQLRAFCRRSGVRLTILRVPGIYAEDRLPLERLRQQLPTIIADEDSQTNHIHANDLAGVIARLVYCAPGGGRAYNVVDDSRLKMGDYFDLVADFAGLPRPPRLPRAQVQAQVSAVMWSFMRESRQLSNARLKQELGVRLRYPTVAGALGLPSPTKQG